MSSTLIGMLAWLWAAVGAPGAAPAWQEVAPGLEYARLVHGGAGSFRPVTIHAFRFSLDDFELRILPASPGGGGATVPELARRTKAVLAVNGGFFAADLTPLGLLVSEGRELNPLRRADWGVFCVARKRAHLVHRRRWRAPGGLEFAIEAGPRLVTPGRKLTFKPHSARRTALGVTRSGRAVIVSTDGPLELATLADRMGRAEQDGGLDCDFALNLDGGSSTQLWFAGHDRTIAVHSPTHVANAVALFRRQGP